jgi:ATP-dependent Clp protease protease subunit
MTIHQLKPSAQPNGYRIVARGKDDADVYLYGVVGSSIWDDGISAKQFADDLKALGKIKTIHLRINSEGGDVFDGKAMYTLLAEHDARVIAHIDGLAASAASYIAMAADEIEMSESAFMMIHNARGVVMGGGDEMRRMADLLDQVDASIVDVYASRTKQDKQKIKKWMADETWFTASEAVQHKFADRMVGNMAIAASVRDPKLFKNLPASLRPNRAKAVAALSGLRHT